MNALSEIEITEILSPYGVSADSKLCEQIREYISLLLRWNQKISLTTIKDPEEILKFHFGESFFAASSVPIENGRLADVGSGAGFPGIPLAMISAGLEVMLIESNAKKAAFLSEVTRALRLNRVKVLRSRMEEVSKNLRTFDFVTARALGSHRELLQWASSFLAESGKIVLWLGGEECTAISRNAAWNWREPIHIPGSRNRFLLIGSPNVPRETYCIARKISLH